VGRTNDKGQREFWFLESSKGRETIGLAPTGLKGGETRITTSFVSGPLNGRIRREEFYDGQAKVRNVMYSYDDAGNLIRKADSQHGISKFSYRNVRGFKIVTESNDGNPASISVYDAAGNLRATSVVMNNLAEQNRHLESIMNEIDTIK